MNDYLPTWATADEAGAWLERQTGEPWPLPRLIEAGALPHVWLVPDDAASPAVLTRAFNGRHEGYCAPLLFAGDAQRLAFDRSGAMTMTRSPEGELLRFAPGIAFEASEVRFSSDHVRRLVAPVPAEKPQAAAAPAGPTPLTTGDLAFSFDGLRYSEARWKKPLGDRPKWLVAAIAVPGQRGVCETRWNPVFVGAELVRQGHVGVNSVRARFQTRPMLRPWLDAWNTYEADYLESD